MSTQTFPPFETAINDTDSRVTANENDIASNSAAISSNSATITANNAAIQAQLSPVVLDGNDNEIGLLADISDYDGWVRVITQQGYILDQLELGSGSVVAGLLRFASANCTGPAFTDLPAGFVGSRYDLSGVPSLFYAAKNSTATAGFVYGSSIGSGGCFAFGGSLRFAWPALPNDPAIIGIFSQSYQLPIKIERP